ncbi:hypothetical protein ALMP_50070 [Streptomyces sp. A012304]|nr:hypothetical protein ALMP_50070 [Streptomyces sp. A012304]
MCGFDRQPCGDVLVGLLPVGALADGLQVAWVVQVVGVGDALVARPEARSGVPGFGERYDVVDVGGMTVWSSYQEYQLPPVRVQRPVLVGGVTASSSRTSARVLHPSRSASVQPDPNSRSRS